MIFLTMEQIWQLITIIVTAIFSAGGGILLAPKIWKKKELAYAKSEEYKAEQERSRADDLDISNTEKVIGVYKQALTDIQELHDKEKLLLQQTIARQDARISEISERLDTATKELERNNKRISELVEESNSLKKELTEIQISMKTVDCDKCEYKLACLSNKTK